MGPARGTPAKGDGHRDVRRRFEQWARNPACQANSLSAVHNVRMDLVAEAGGLPKSMGQSPFAIQRGQTFERVLFAHHARDLVAELRRAGLVPAGEVGFEDCRLRLHSGPFKSLDEARKRTSDILRGAAASPGTRATVVAGATISIPGGVMLPEAILAIDALIVRADLSPTRLIVGEIKTYPDRGGYTDRAELAGARAQAGVYVHGLRVVIEHELGLSGQLLVENQGVLVLSRPGYNRPSARPSEDLRYQSVRAARGFVALHEVADDFDGELFAAPIGEQVVAVWSASTAYTQECWTFCDLAPECHRRALEAGSAAVLGEDVVRFLGEVPLARALELLDGARPRGPAEEDLARRFHAFDAVGGAL